MADAIIQQIQGESLSNLLTSVATETAPLGPTSIRALDVYCCSTGSGSSPDSPLKLGDVLEIQGAPASGKTHFIYYLLATCVMPSNHGSITMHGWEKAAIVFDTDKSFDIFRFKQILIQRLHTLVAAGEILQVVERCLSRLAIIPVSSTLHLAVSILNTPGYLARLFPRSEFGMLAVDSISSFYWSDRFAAEKPADGFANISQPSQNRFRSVVMALQKIRTSLAPVIILSNWGLTPTHTSPPLPYYRQHLVPFPNPFSVTREGPGQVVFANPNLLPLTFHITTELREGAEKKSRFTGHLRCPGTNTTGRIEFTVNEEGIDML